MAWHLNSNPGTGILPEFSTELDHREDLQPGDILNDAVNHVIIFDRWTDKANGDFMFYAFGRAPVHYSPGNIYASKAAEIDGHPSGNYTPRRYNNVIEDGGAAPAGPQPPSAPQAPGVPQPPSIPQSPAIPDAPHHAGPGPVLPGHLFS
jgi:hypothetical protein